MIPRPSLELRVIQPVLRLLELADPRLGRPDPTNPAALDAAVRAIDLALVSQYPASRAMSPEFRRRLIRRIIEANLANVRGAAPTIHLDELALTDDERARLESTAPGNSVQGLSLDADPTLGIADLTAIAKQALGEGWEVLNLDPEPDPDDDGFRILVAVDPSQVLSVPEAWTLAHRLAERSEISAAAPNVLHVPAPEEIGGPDADLETNLRGVFGSGELSCSEAKTWHLGLVHAGLAEQYSIDQQRPRRGRGITIGHLDTGITHHAEVDLGSGKILVDRGRNFWDPDHPQVGRRPLDPMDSDLSDVTHLGFKTFDGHGTGTLSIITGSRQLIGTARDATIIPFRVAPTVVHFDLTRMAQAMRAAHKAGCDVITMSMGGPKPKTGALRDAIQRAVKDGVIVCTAAGNGIGSKPGPPMVVWPAAFPEVIAVAGCNCQWKPWNGSSRGPAVNITAGGQAVWNADPTKGSLAPGGSTPTKVSRGNGTSFATPTVAGLAACWLAHHGGRQAIADAHYEGERRYVPLAFAHILRHQAYTEIPKWDTKHFGPGVFDALKLMKAPLPHLSELESGWPEKSNPFLSDAVSVVVGWFGAHRAAPTPPKSLAQYEAEIEYLLFDRPGFLKQLNESGEVAGRSASRADSPDDSALADLLTTSASEQLREGLAGMVPSPDTPTPRVEVEVAPPSVEGRVDWTLLVYIAGDNNLDGEGLRDLEEMKRGLGASQAVNVVVQRDTTGVGRATLRYRLSGSGSLEDDVVDDSLGETNTGDPEVLAEFLRWGLSKYPATRTMAVLWNHGSGWDDTDIYRVASRHGIGTGNPRLRPGLLMRRRAAEARPRGPYFLSSAAFRPSDYETRAIAFDDEAQDFIDNVEMRDVFTRIVADQGRPFDLIGMDACLMSMLETATQLHGCAEVLCGSQDVEPGPGWPYEAILRRLVARPAMTGAELATVIVDEFVSHYPNADRITQSAWSAAPVPELAAATDALGKFLADELEGSAAGIDRALRLVQRQVQRFDTADYADLGDFCRLLAAEHPAAEPACGRVLDALDACVLHNRFSGPSVPRPTGLSIYLPLGTPLELYETLEFGQGGWARFLKTL